MERLLPWLVGIVASGCALLPYLRFLQSPRLLWSDAIHDRNAHLYSGLCLAMDVRLGDLRHLFPDLDSFRTWPPLHDGLLVGAALLLGNGDERWAVLPSLAAWAGSAVFAFLLARRCAPAAGPVAGLLAALFVLVSPAQRAFATDVMLESAGACLSLACLYLYVAALQDRTQRAYIRLALSLTLLFFTKYNYWLLVVLGMAVDRLVADPKRPIAWAQAWMLASRSNPNGPASDKDQMSPPELGAGGRFFHVRATQWLAAPRKLSGPANCALLLILAASAALAIAGEWHLKLFGGGVTVRPSPNLLTINYAVCFIRLIPWYRRVGRVLLGNAGAGVRALAAWHFWPVALWFLWPHRLYSFLWVLDPASNAGEFPRHDLFGGYAAYWNSFARDYHIGPWSAVIVTGLFLVAVWAGLRGRLRPGAAAILWFVAIACILTVHHQNRKSRFLHSWIPLVWVSAGIGAAALAPKRRVRDAPAAWLGFAVAAGAIALPHLPGLAATAHAPEGEIHPGQARSWTSPTPIFPTSPEAGAPPFSRTCR